MTMIRTLALAVAAAVLVSMAAPALGGQPTSVGKGLGTALTTSGQSGSHVSSTPGQAAPTPGFALTPGQGTTTATSTPASTNNPNPSNIGHGTTK